MVDPLSLFVLGLTYGLTVCSLTCLPYLAPYLMGTGSSFKNGMTNSFCFMFGKLIVYSSLGGIAAYIGQNLEFGKYSSIIMGSTLVAVALTMPFVNRGKCQKRCPTAGKNISMFILGAGSSLMPCPPLAAIFMLAAQSGSVPEGIFYGLIYGTGLIMSPLIIAGGGLAFIAGSIRQQLGAKMKYIEVVSILIMVNMGLNIIFSTALVV
jgi:cytochrome c-type biogenesis protein